MLAALVEGPRRRLERWTNDAWSLWMMNGGDWWRATGRKQSANAWIEALSALPFCARVKTQSGWIGLVHTSPVHGQWHDLETWVHGDENLSHVTRTRALWSRVRHGHVQREIGETGQEHLGQVEGVRCVITGHTPMPEPAWHENVLGIDTGVHIAERGYGRLTIARIDGTEIETLSFDR